MYLYQLGVITAIFITLLLELFLIMCGVGGIAKDKKSWNYHLSPVFLYLALSGLTTIALIQDPIFFYGGEWWQ
jgi:hypothetical protein